MENPYRSESNEPKEVAQSPLWYVWFYRAYAPMWWLGTIIIILSWLEIVSAQIGWVGFGLVGFAFIGAYLFPSLAGVTARVHVVLDSRLLDSRGEGYARVMHQFRNGACLTYDGVAFEIRENNEVACGVVAVEDNVDRETAKQIFDHARGVFEFLVSNCDEFALVVRGRTFRVSILAGFGDNAVELCRVVDGEFEWQNVV